MKSFAHAFGSVALLAVLACGCQHRVKPQDLTLPPDLIASGISEVSGISAEQATQELKAIAQMPYPAYRIQGGDSFRVRVYNEEEFSPDTASSTTVVTPDGYIVVALADPILIKDLTILEATRKVEAELRRFLRYPHVSLIPVSMQGKKASLLGAVDEPGNYNVTEQTRLADFVANGAGMRSGILNDNTVDMGDISNSYMMRDGRILPVDFTEALQRGNPLHNIRIIPGDIIYIATRESSRVIVMGQVHRPTAINWEQNITVADAVARAGGLADEYWRFALILRRKQGGALDIYKINVDDLLAGRTPNCALASGDIVYIPRDDISEYNVFIKKLIPTAQLVNLITSPIAYWVGGTR